MATRAELIAANAVIPAGEIWQESDTKKRKRGDGAQSYTQLPYEGSGNITVDQLDPDDMFGALSPLIVTAVGNPETATSSAVTQLINSTAAGGFANYERSYEIGTNIAAARPTWAGPVVWYQTVSADAVPLYAIVGDRYRYVVPTAAPWTPLQLPSLTAWYDAKAISATDGASVASWSDLSPYGTHMVQATGTAQPTYRATGLGSGKPSVQFDGTSDWLTANITSYTGAWTVYLVGQSLPATITSSSDFFFDGTGATPAYPRLGYYRATTQLANANRGSGFAGPTMDNAIHRHKIVFNGASSSIQIDAGTASTGTTSLSGIDIVKLALGARADGSGFLDGHIGEVIFVQGTVSAPNDALVASYLQGRWGVA